MQGKWIRTPTLAVRNATERPKSFLGELAYPWHAALAILRLINSTYHGTSLGATTGNTAFLHWRNRLYALMEAAYPIEVDPWTLETGLLSSFDGVLRGSLTAHPKVDPDTDELIAFGYIPPSSSLKYYVIGGSEGPFVSSIDFSDNGTSSRFCARVPHDFAVVCVPFKSCFFSLRL